MLRKTLVLWKAIFLYKCKIYTFCLFNVGILAFLLFTQRIPMILEGPTSLNYYWVPLLVRAGVLFSLGCYNKIPWTGWLKRQEFIFHILKPEKYKIKVPTDLITGEGCLPGLQRDTSLLHPNMVEKEISSPASSCKGTNPIHKDSTLTTWKPPKHPTFKCHYIED